MSDNAHKIDDILRLAVAREASDVHILTRLPPMIRVGGRLIPTEFPALTWEECRQLVHELLTPQQIRQFEETRELDFSYGIEGVGRFRINLHYQRGSPGIAIRPIKSSIPTFEELGLPAQILTQLLSYPHGLILVCGPTGSGKSTTLAAMVDYLNEREPLHIVTIEDPIEYLFKHKVSVVEQREIGTDTDSFTESLRRILRQDPDVALIGEMRDLETISAALRIAETGHLVFATLHTGETIQALGRIVNSFPGEEQAMIRTQLSLILLGVFVQQLLPRQDKKGRILATEVMVCTPAIRNMIREGQAVQVYSAIQLGGNLGMHTMNASLINLYKKGMISREDAISYSPNQKEVVSLLKT